MKILHLVLLLVLIEGRALGQDGSVSQAEQQKRGVDLLTATEMHDGHGGVIYLEFKPEDLRERHLHLLCEVVTTEMVFATTGPAPPAGMITKGKEGMVYRGELFSFAGDNIEIHARYEGQADSYKTVVISKKDVVYLTFPEK